MSKFDTTEPILVLVRRGRKGRGFSVSPVEDISNASACLDEKELGETIGEMLDDPNQPRVNVGDLLSAASGQAPESEEDTKREPDKAGKTSRGRSEPADEEAEEEQPESGEAPDLADQFLMQGLAFLIGKGREMSSTKVRTRRK